MHQQQQQQQAGGMHTACGEHGMRQLCGWMRQLCRWQQPSYAHCKQQADCAHFELRGTQAHVP